MTAHAAAPDASTTGKHIPALDGIRGLAILLVFGLHFFWGAPYYGHNPVLWTIGIVRDLGWIGVDLFFVLSGFLITGILYDTITSPRFFRNFYGRRILRIFPLYYGLLLAVVVVSIFTHHAWNHDTFLRDATFTDTLFSVPWTGLHMSTAPTITLPHTNIDQIWSLMIEEQFYFFWPLSIFLLRTRRRIAIAAVCIVVLSVATRFVLTTTHLPAANPYVLYSFTFSRLDGLAMGALLAMLVRSRFEHRVLRFGGFGFAAGVVVLLLMGVRWPHLDWHAYWAAATWGFLALAFTFASMIAWALRRGSLAERVFALPVLRFFGRYSYGLYLLMSFFAGLAGIGGRFSAPASTQPRSAICLPRSSASRLTLWLPGSAFTCTKCVSFA
jgi:peptidoglycan/LPS O-acetylase OafA/YrhL